MVHGRVCVLIPNFLDVAALGLAHGLPSVAVWAKECIVGSASQQV